MLIESNATWFLKNRYILLNRLSKLDTCGVFIWFSHALRFCEASDIDGITAGRSHGQASIPLQIFVFVLCADGCWVEFFPHFYKELMPLLTHVPNRYFVMSSDIVFSPVWDPFFPMELKKRYSDIFPTTFAKWIINLSFRVLWIGIIFSFKSNFMRKTSFRLKALAIWRVHINLSPWFWIHQVRLISEMSSWHKKSTIHDPFLLNISKNLLKVKEENVCAYYILLFCGIHGRLKYFT